MKTFILFIFLTGAVLAAPQYPPELPGTKIETYKKASGVQLKVWIYNPDGHQASDKKPAVVFFFGGDGNPDHRDNSITSAATLHLAASSP